MYMSVILTVLGYSFHIQENIIIMLYSGLIWMESSYLNLRWNFHSEHYFMWGSHNGHYFFGFMTHYEITIGNDVAKDVHCDIIMGHEVVMVRYHDVTMYTEFVMYYYAQIWYFCFLRKIFKILD